MERVNRILQHPVFRREMEQIARWEEDRIYCRHDLSHSLDVARICWIMILEKELSYSREIIYGAALLHDIGRARQYTARIAHEVAGVVLAKEILTDCGYSDQEIELICAVIGAHRIREPGGDDTLSELFARADKLSRNCFACRVTDSCNWPEERLNRGITR